MHQLRLLQWTTFFFVQSIFSSSAIDPSAPCDESLPPAGVDPLWPAALPDRFRIVAEVTTDLQTIEVSQTFFRGSRDTTHFRSDIRNVHTYDDFDISERLIIERNGECERRPILADEHLRFVTGDIVKPSILLGFDGRNNQNNAFFPRYVLSLIHI